MKPEFIQCLTCGYDLRGLSSRRCPECGRAFDPDDPATFHHRPLGITETIRMGCAALCLTWLSPVLALFGIAATRDSSWGCVTVALMLPGSVLCAIALGEANHALRFAPEYRKRALLTIKWLSLATLLLMAMISLLILLLILVIGLS